MYTYQNIFEIKKKVLHVHVNTLISSPGPLQLFVCLFDVVLRPTQEYFTHMETSPYAGEGLQILAYARHLWPLSSEGSFTCQHLLRHGTSSFTVSSEGQDTNQCSQCDSNSRPHDPKSSSLPTEPPGRLQMTKSNTSVLYLDLLLPIGRL